jgi:hypothetical protein
VNSPPPKPEVILTNFFAEPTVLLVPITSRERTIIVQVRYIIIETKEVAVLNITGFFFRIRTQEKTYSPRPSPENSCGKKKPVISNRAYTCP